MTSEDGYGLCSLKSLQSLCNMLRDNADKILSGEMSVTITSSTLYELNEAVDNLQDGLSPQNLALASGSNDESANRASDLEDWNFYLQLVLDIISTAPILVLYKGKNSRRSSCPQNESILQPLRLGYFTSLRHLEMCSVPVQSIQDLLKMRERLRSLVVHNCVTPFTLEDVLEMCEQDVSIPMQWSVLSQLCFRGNSLAELDGSLRLCPRLEKVDLSRNRLTTTNGYLGYLMELTYLDLSYNNLCVLPSLSATAKRKLKVLLLAGNKLTSLAGVDEMTSLEELNVSENLISSHHHLQPLKGLHRLDSLNMMECPSSLRKDHRIKTVLYISSVSLSRTFYLDGRYISHKEIQSSRSEAVRKERMSRPVTLPRHVPTPSTSRLADVADGLSHMEGNFQNALSRDISEDVTVGVISTRKRKGGRKAKSRTMDIVDMDLGSGADLSSKDVTPSSTPKAPSRLETLAKQRRQVVQERKAEMENLRNFYGESWLQAVEDQGIIPSPAPMENSSVQPEGAAAVVAECGQLEVAQCAEGKQSLVPTVSALNTFDENRIANAEAQVSEAVAEWNQNLLESSGEAGCGAEDENGGKASQSVFSKDTMFLSSVEDEDTDYSPPCQLYQPCTDSVAVCEGAADCAVSGQHKAVMAGAGHENIAASAEATTSPLDGAVCSTQNSNTEPEEESEPFIVTLPDKGDNMFLLTVSPRFLVEKDLNGCIQDKLDLQGLETVMIESGRGTDSQSKLSVATDDNDTQSAEVKILLEFSAFRKDRRHREYIMEDFEAAQHLSNLVQPFVDAKLEAAMRKWQTQYECLKCSHHFIRGEAFSNTFSVSNTSDAREKLQCPQCKSDHVVLMETEKEKEKDEEVVTSKLSASLPSPGLSEGFYAPKHSLDQSVYHTPQAESTPLKKSSSSSWFSSSMDYQASRSGSQQRLFSDRSSSLCSKMQSDDLLIWKMEGDSTLANGHHRSKAFHGQLPGETRQRSDAVASHAEFNERKVSGSIGSHHSDLEKTRCSVSGSSSSFSFNVGRTRQSVTNSLILADVESPSLQQLHSSDNAHGLVTVNNLEWSPVKSVTLSVESDIAILNKRESVASVTVLSSTSVPSHSCPSDSAITAQLHGKNEEKYIGESNGDSGFEWRERDTVRTSDRGQLSPVPQRDSVEVTPMGSPLSSSICSSMVSSVYHNSLPPNSSASSVYATASDHSSARDGEDTEHGTVDTENERSVSKHDDPHLHSKAHKVSISSEVEVLLVEEGSSHSIAVDEEENNFSNVYSTVTNSDETDTTVAGDVLQTVDDEDDSGDGAECWQEASQEARLYDYTRLDHRLALHVMMTVFDDNEEFKFKVKTTVCQYMMQEEYQALVLVTNIKLYILRINSDTDDDSVTLAEALTLMEAQPHTELKRVNTGLGRQTLRLEYCSDCSSYTLVLRDRLKVGIVTELLSGQLQEYGRDTGLSLSTVFNEDVDQQTLDTLDKDVLNKKGKNQVLRLYILGYIARGHNPNYPLAFVVGSSQVCLVKPNHQWPCPHLQTPITEDSIGKQFTVLERQKVIDIASVSVHAHFKNKVLLTFFNENSGEETTWNITMETKEAALELIDAVREPWQMEFGVELDLDFSVFDSSS